MKQIMFVLFLCKSLLGFAQNTKAISGSYTQGSIAGITIYEDSTFALYGYATLVFGVYKMTNNKIFFTPDIPEKAFSIIGRKNMNIKTGSRFTFTRNFDDDGPTFIKIDEGNFQRIFDESNEQGRPYYNIDIDKKPQRVSLGLQTQNHKHKFNTNTFILDSSYNEFLLFYYPTISEQKPFVGEIISKNKAKALACTWGTFRKVENEERGDKEMMQYLKIYKKEKLKNKEAKVFYLNDQLKSAKGFNYLSEQENIFNINNYILDQNSNKYIHKSIYQKSKNYKDALVEDYHDENIILKYNLLEPIEITNIDFNKIALDQKFLFPNDNPEIKKEKKEEDRWNEKEREDIPLDKPLEPVYIKPIPVPENSKKKN